jgi:uncharacterized protein (TIGR03435 family)
MMMGPGRIMAGSMSMTVLANSLSQMVGRVVYDKTGLTGAYDLTLSYTPDQMAAGGGGGVAIAIGAGPGGPGGAFPAPDPNGASIFTALQEQLGLKLDSAKGPVKVFVIDRAEQPAQE